MTSSNSHIRNGLGAVRPYVYARDSVLAKVKGAFGGEIVGSSPDGSELEVRVADSVIAFAIGDDFPTGVATVASIYVYVPDVDATYAEALQAGGVSTYAPEDKPWGERQGAVKDEFGNAWYIATYTGGT